MEVNCVKCHSSSCNLYLCSVKAKENEWVFHMREKSTQREQRFSQTTRSLIPIDAVPQSRKKMTMCSMKKKVKKNSFLDFVLRSFSANESLFFYWMIVKKNEILF